MQIKLFYKSFFIVVSMLLVIMGCSPILGGGGNEEPETITSILSNLPELSFKLPGSFGGDENSTKSKALGTTTISNSAEPVKSQYWVSLNQSTLGNPYINAGLKNIREFSRTHEVKLEKAYKFDFSELEKKYIWEELLPSWGAVPANLIMKANFMATGSVSNFTLHIWHEVKWDDPDYRGAGTSFKSNTDIYTKLNIKTENHDKIITLAIKFICPLIMDDQEPYSFDMKMYSQMNSNTHSGISVAHYTAYGSMSGSKYIPYTDGSIGMINKTTYIDTLVDIGWGNNNIGGYVDSQDDFDFTAEYYDQHGNLLLTEFGGETLDYVTDFDFLGKYNAQLNFYSNPPSNIYLKKDTGYYITDDIASPINWIPISGYGWNDSNSDNIMEIDETVFGFYWKTADQVSQYDWVETINHPTEGIIKKYTLNYDFVTTENYVGRELYLIKQYPMNQILPVSEGYSDYQLVKIEGNEQADSMENWYDVDGNYQLYYKYNNLYFLDSNDNLQYDDDVDIFLSDFTSQPVYNWNNGNYYKFEDKFYRSNNVPAYFTSPSTSIDIVKSRINELYETEFLNFDLDAYYNLTDAIDPNDSYFTQLKE